MTAVTFPLRPPRLAFAICGWRWQNDLHEIKVHWYWCCIKRILIIYFELVEDRTVTLDVNPSEYSYIPHPEKDSSMRTQRSASYDTNSYYNYPGNDYRYGSNSDTTGTSGISNGQEQLATAYGQEDYYKTNADSNYYYNNYDAAQDSANNNTNSNSPAYNSYYSAQQDNSSATLYNSNDVSASNSTSNQTEYAAPNTASSYTDANNSTQENAFVKQDALSLTNSSAATADYNVSPYNGTDNSSSPLASDTRYSDQQSAGYTYSEQALAPAQTPSPAQSPYPAYAPSPAPYPAPYSYPAPYPSPYPAPAYAPYPAPAPYPYPAYAPYSYPSSYPAPAQAPSPAPAEVKNETSK